MDLFTKGTLTQRGDSLLQTEMAQDIITPEAKNLNAAFNWKAEI